MSYFSPCIYYKLINIYLQSGYFMLTIVGTSLAREKKRDKKFPSFMKLPKILGLIIIVDLQKRLFQYHFQSLRESQGPKEALLSPPSQILDNYCQALHILKAGCLETYTGDLTMIITILSEIIPHTSHVSHHMRNCIKL